MTHGKGRKVIHRNDGTLATASSVTSRNSSIKEESSCDVDDPIRAHRVQPAYIDAASSVPGAEVVRSARFATLNLVYKGYKGFCPNRLRF